MTICKTNNLNLSSSEHLCERRRNSRMAQGLSILILLSILTTLLSACGGDPRAQQQASQSRAAFDRTFQQATDVGVPAAQLKSILQQKQDLEKSQAPLTLFNDQADTTYYKNLTTRYDQLRVQTQGLIVATTEQFEKQAQNDLQRWQTLMNAQRGKNLPLDMITKLYNQSVASMTTARYPKDYTSIINHATSAIATINMLPDTLTKLDTLHTIITTMSGSNQDVSTLQKQYTDDQQAIAQVTSPEALQHINQTIDAQNQQAATRFALAIPVLAQAKVDELASKVQQLAADGINTSSYQQRLDAERQQQPKVKTLQDYLAFSQKVDADLAAMRGDLLKGQAMTLLKQFHQEVTDWGNAHLYYDKYDGNKYALDGGYTAKGIGEDLDKELNEATTADDYQQALTDIQNEYFHLHMLEADYNDKTPFSQVHQTDMQLIDHYKLQKSQVIIISFVEEALRVYDNGKLVRAFLVTAGRPELPPVPGVWSPLWRQTHTTFKSPYPKGSPYWYADTPINYAIMYHYGGYFLHDSWWRNDYGPGTQFYHIDSSGNASANHGTHGCVNIPLDQAAWLYNNTSYNTSIVMY
jgi:hypothetical protein